jgi:protein kinase C substrate 80K-H
MRVWLIENGILADNPTAGQESVLITSARDAVTAVEGDLLSKNTALTDQESDLAKDYGPEGVLRAIKDRCISTDSGEYTYELCWLGQTTQKSKKGHGDTSMGTYVGVETHDADEEERADGKGLGSGKRLVLRYDNGQGCWNGPNRRTDVWLACAESEELWRVSESEKCVYKMEVGTPVACEQALQPEAVPRAKDEL